jgi:biotin carboxyl carrier protein
MKIFAEIKDQLWTFDQDDDQLLSENAGKIQYTFSELGNNRYTFILDGKSYLIHVIKENGFYHVHLDGNYFAVRIEDERSRELRRLVEHSAGEAGGQTVHAPIPGLITQIKVKEGDKVKKGDGLILLEAMKMENEIKAETEGVVDKIMISAGRSVEKDQILMKIK